jgi:CBS domain-containing protein
MKLAEVMTTNVMTVNLSDPASTAGRLMWNCDCGAIPVVQDDGRAVGMITDRDICMSAVLRDRSPSAIPVFEAMSKPLIACSARDDLETAEQLMCRHRVRRIPIIDDDGRPVGIVSLGDLVRASQGNPRRASMYSHDITPTLAIICERRTPM